MGKHRIGARLPTAVNCIQINCCRTPSCANFGIPPSEKRQPRGKGVGLKGRDSYTASVKTRSARREKAPGMTCNKCNSSFIFKSNAAITEEAARLAAYLENPKPLSCPVETCANHRVGVKSHGELYQSFGSTPTGSKRYRCKLCKKTFSLAPAIVRQNESHLNPIVFRLLVNKVPFRRICEVCDISFSTLLWKIDFIYKQCLSFVADRERKLVAGEAYIGKVYVGVDRQDYLINWGKTDDKRNIRLHAVGSADNKSGYVFGIHLDYDCDLNADAVELDALSCGDYELEPAFRKHARVFLKRDYRDSCLSNPGEPGHNKHDIVAEIAQASEAILGRDDPDVSVYQDPYTQLPAAGMQVHGEYTTIAHFFYLKQLLCGASKVRFALDQDPGMETGALTAFRDEILRKDCDVFLVQINKNLSNGEKLGKKSATDRELDQLRNKYPMMYDHDLKLMLLEENVKGPTRIRKRDWVEHPFPNMSEPEKMTCYLTDLGDRAYDIPHLARLHDMTSLHAIDLFFMQARRRLSIAERAISTASNKNKRWYGYSAYNPERIVKLLEILRVYYNYVLPTDKVPNPKKRTRNKTGPTRAMKLGLAKAPINVKDIIYFMNK